MNQELITFLASQSPILSDALKTPAADLVVAYISSKFGSPPASDLLARIKADPEYFIKIESIEYYILAALKPSDAPSSSKKFRRRLAYIITFGFFGALFFLFFPQVQITETEKSVLSMLVGVLTSNWQTIIDSVYGHK